jgi:hypothetical protein
MVGGDFLSHPSMLLIWHSPPSCRRLNAVQTPTITHPRMTILFVLRRKTKRNDAPCENLKRCELSQKILQSFQRRLALKANWKCQEIWLLWSLHRKHNLSHLGNIQRWQSLRQYWSWKCHHRWVFWGWTSLLRSPNDCQDGYSERKISIRSFVSRTWRPVRGWDFSIRIHGHEVNPFWAQETPYHALWFMLKWFE